MRGYAEAEVFTSLDMTYLRYATDLVEGAPSKIGKGDEEEWVRCHELARAIGAVLDLVVVDGSYGACEHSWLMTPDRRVLDVYVPARVPQVQLVDARCPWAQAEYRAGERRTDIRQHVIDELSLITNSSRTYEISVAAKDDARSAAQSIIGEKDGKDAKEE
jgi:hypothetical protein